MPEKLRLRDYTLITTRPADQALQLAAAVLDHTVDIQEAYRDNKRTLSARFRFDGQALVLKIPRARNARMWERMLTWFRLSESFRIFNSQLILRNLGFSGPVPVLAASQRIMGCVVDSFVVYEYLEGAKAQDKDAQAVMEALICLHEQGYLRGDPQLANFIVKDGKILFIDFKLKKASFWPRLQTHMELAQFLKKCPAAYSHLPVRISQSRVFRIASFFQRVKSAIRKQRRQIKFKMKGRSKSKGS